MFYKQLLSAISIAITLAAFYPYLRDILRGSVRPHVFSWIIWGSTTFIVFLAQIQGGGGVGAWPVGVSATITIGVAVLAYLKRADLTIAVVDWVFFVAAISSLPLWYFTTDPMWAVVLLTTVDVLGFGPTLRKAYADPYSESALFFSMFMVRNVLVVLALENYSITTVLFPAAIAVTCAAMVAMLVLRRRGMSRAGPAGCAGARMRSSPCRS